ncbi:hypothetical protein HJFPF1_04480 [Paramyrothecium foliicola]|nr:hypothetical protein HJFPF1_04480 [Paramyrothecium foliicola]
MLLSAAHTEKSIPALRKLVQDYPLGVLTTAIPHSTNPLILSTHIPFVLDVQDVSSRTELGVLRAHLARANPQSKSMMDALTAEYSDEASGQTLSQEVLVLFTSDVQHYVTPKFYTETKPYTGKVVPTWNYASVQAYGRIRVFFDSKSERTSEFLNNQMHDLSQNSETKIMGFTGEGEQPRPWKVSDAPEPYLEIMKKNIIGIEIVIERLEGKFKMSQEMRLGDREGVVKGFEKMDTDVAQRMAQIVKERSDLKESSKAV